MKTILIDTRIWALALKSAYFTEDNPDYESGIEANELIETTLENDIVLMSSQLVAEIYHVTTYRGIKVPKEDVQTTLNNLIKSNHVNYKEITKEVMLEAVKLSVESGIHIWDFLVVLPFKGEIDKIYTMDPHFKDERFTQIAKVENPFGVWKVESKE